MVKLHKMSRKEKERLKIVTDLKWWCLIQKNPNVKRLAQLGVAHHRRIPELTSHFTKHVRYFTKRELEL